MILPSEREPTTVVTVFPIEPSWLGIIEALCRQRQDMIRLGLGIQARQIEAVLRAVTSMRKAYSQAEREAV